MAFGKRTDTPEPPLGALAPSAEMSVAVEQPKRQPPDEYTRDLFSPEPTLREAEMIYQLELYYGLSNAVDAIGNTAPGLRDKLRQKEATICDLLEHGSGVIRLPMGPGTMTITLEKCFMEGKLVGRWFKQWATRDVHEHFDRTRRKYSPAHFLGRHAVLGLEQHGLIHTAETAALLNAPKTT